MARIGVLPGTFNPVTRAHVAIADAALEYVDEVVFVLPRAFPHKLYAGASVEERLQMLAAATAGQPRFSVAQSSGGLFIDIARELRASGRTDARLSFVCGRDAAERIVGWDYGDPRTLGEMQREFDLLVAARAGEYRAPDEIARWVEALPLAPDYEQISSTEVRARIADGRPWEHLTPAAIENEVRRIYRGVRQH